MTYLQHVTFMNVCSYATLSGAQNIITRRWQNGHTRVAVSSCSSTGKVSSTYFEGASADNISCVRQKNKMQKVPSFE